MIRVGVLGALGRMGAEVCRAVIADPETALVAAIDPRAAGEKITVSDGGTIVVSDEIDTLSQAEADVAVDFTHPDAVMDDVRWCVRHAMHCVVGTTGLGDTDLDAIRALIDEEGNESNVFVAPNFAIGAVLMVRFAAAAARHFPHVEIIEMHHDGKADAPSGTALATARIRDLARGGTLEGISIHSIRLPGLVAHQEVILGSPGQTLTIRHDSVERSSFMPGVLLAVKNIQRHPGLTIGLETLLD